MKTLLIITRGINIPAKRLVMIGAALLVVAGLFMVSIFLPPLTTPVHALNAPTTQVSQVLANKGVSGTLASFTALIQDITAISLPLVVR